MLKLFEMKDRFWWGAFLDGRLIAYYYTILLEDTLTIGAAKSHSDFLSHCPNDVLLFTVVSDAFNNRGCRSVEYGDWSPEDERLLYFKQSYGFTRRDFPEYIHLNALSRPLLRLRQLLRRGRRTKAAVTTGTADE
jgi:hypothetical protein